MEKEAPVQVHLSRSQRIAHVAAALSAAIALVTLSATYVKSCQMDRAAIVSRWQAVVVFETLRDAGPGGEEFKAILETYTNAAARFQESEVPRDAISEAALRQVLLRLLAEQVISYVPPDRYKLFVRPGEPPPSQIDMQITRSQEIESLLFTEGSDGCMDRDQLRIKFFTKLPNHDRVAFDRTVDEGLRAGALQGDTDRVCLRSYSPAQPNPQRK